MINLIKRRKYELFCIEKDNIAVDKLNHFFEKSFNGEVVYVEESGKIVGIITRGDYIKHLCSGSTLINTNFKFLTEDCLEKVTEFAQNPNIRRVPVIENGVVIYDFVLTGTGYERMYYGNKVKIKCFIELLLEIGIKQIMFINNSNSASKLVEVFNKHRINEINVYDVPEYEIERIDDTLYIDDNFFRKCRKKRENHCYQILSEGEMFMFISRPEQYCDGITSICQLISNTYKDIVVYDRNYLTKKIIKFLKEHKTKFHVLKSDGLEFNLGNQCICSKNEINCDVIVTAGFDTISYPIISNGKSVYCLNISNRGVSSWIGYNSQDLDVINNVLPYLEDKGVKVLILERLWQSTDLEKIYYVSLDKYGITKPLEKNYQTCLPLSRFKYEYSKGYAYPMDCAHDNITIKDGMRRTIGNTGAKRKVYFVGACQYSGAFVKDEDMVEKYFQELVKEEYDVYNYSILEYQTPWQMRLPDYNKDDVLILEVPKKEIYEKNGYKVHVLSDIIDEFSGVKEDVVWDIWCHSNGVVNKRVAELIYDICKKENIF